MDRKAIRLSFFKKACWFDLNKDPAQDNTLYRNYRTWFRHALVPVNNKDRASVNTIMDDLGGIIVPLNEDSMKAVDYMNNHFITTLKTLPMFPMVETIRCGSPKKPLPEKTQLFKCYLSKPLCEEDPH